MIKINDADGKTQETPIVITDADNDVEAKIFYYKYLEYYQQYHGYDWYDAEEVGHTLDQLLAVHRFYKNGVMVDELWIDYTIFFHKWDKQLPGRKHLWIDPWKTIPWEHIKYKNKRAEHELPVRYN